MQRVRRFVRAAHLGLGLSVGALFVVLGISGSLLVFYQEIDAAVHPEIQVTGPAEAPGWRSPVWDKALATVRREWPERTGAWRFEASGKPAQSRRVMSCLAPALMLLTVAGSSWSGSPRTARACCVKRRGATMP